MEKEDRIRGLLKKGEILEIEKELENAVDLSVNLKILKTLIKVFKVEIQNNIEHSIFEYSVDFDELILHYKKIKALLRRVEFDLPMQEVIELYSYCTENRVSQFLLGVIILSSMYHRKKVCKRVIDLWKQNGEEDTAFIRYLNSVEKYLEGQQDEQ